MAKPKVGDKFEVISGPMMTVERDGREVPFAFPIPVGVVVTVEDYVEAAETGAHDDSEDSVVVSWEVDAFVEDHTDEKGEAKEPASYRTITDNETGRVRKTAVFKTVPGKAVQRLAVGVSNVETYFRKEGKG